MIIEIIRHGETALQSEHRYQGITDAPLSAYGKAKLRPSNENVSRVYVTKLKRTHETAKILFPNAEQVIVNGLEEMNFGIFEGKNYIELLDSAEYKAWLDSMCEAECPNGESKQSFSDRVCYAFAELLDSAFEANTEKLTIVAHGGTVMSIMARFAIPEKGYFDWHLESGQGYLLNDDRWYAEHKLMLKGQTDYTKE